MQVYDRKGNFVRLVLRRKDFKVEEKLDGGIARKQLSFTYPLEDGRIRCEETIEYGGERYRVKEAPAKGYFGSAVAAQDTGGLSGFPHQAFSASGWTLTQCVGAALSGTGWSYENVTADDTDTRDMSESGTDSMKLLEKIAEIFWVEIAVSAKEKKIYLYSRIGDAGKNIRFTKGFNLKTLEVKADTYEFYTRIFPAGKDGLTIEDVNGGKAYLDDNGYSGDVRALIWEDTGYTDASQLMRAAREKLKELAAPKTAYTAQVIDVARILDGYGDFEFALGDEADIIDPDLEVNTRERIVHITRYPDRPEKNTVEFSSRTASFADVQKKMLAAVSRAANGGIVVKPKTDSGETP